jgi:hypothetical protein
MAGSFRSLDIAYPGGVSDSWQSWPDWCDQMWQMYANTAYRDVLQWASYLYRAGLYRNTRPIFNPTHRVVDFYAANVYPGTLTIDPDADLDPGGANAIPIRKAAKESVLLPALEQLWEWSDFQGGKEEFVRNGAMTGGSLMEVFDNVERQKVSLSPIWSAHTQNVVVDSAGNVKSYDIAYQSIDDRGVEFAYRKTVDSRTIRYFRDGREYERDGIPAVQRNIYGFAPAVWARHTRVGGTIGLPAIYSSLSKIDEVNSWAAHVLDHGHKLIASPMVLTGATGFSNAAQIRAGRRQSQLGAPDSADAQALRSQVPLLFAPAGASLIHLTGNLNLPDTIALIEKMQAEIMDDLYELTSYKDLRAMSSVTGPAATRLMGDVVGRLNAAQAVYDTQVKKAFQMALAIGGYRYNNGDWPDDNDQQRKFAPFNLDSWRRGDLDFRIGPRPLIALTPEEQINRTRQTLSLAGDQVGADALNAFGEALGGAGTGTGEQA